VNEQLLYGTTAQNGLFSAIMS